MSSSDALRDALTRLWPAIERGMGGLVFTAERAGEVAADMQTVRAAISAPAPAPAEAAQTDWRKLAMQFDAQRMSALWHIKALLQDPQGHADKAREFLGAAPAAPAGWQPIETAPMDRLILLYGAKRSEMVVGMNHSRDGWVIDTPSEWASMYPPKYWMPLPAAPGAPQGGA